MRLAGSRLTPRPHRLAYPAVIKGPGMSNSNYYAALLGALDINDSSPRSSSAVEAFPGSRLKKKKSFSSSSPTTENGHVEASSTAVATGDGAATASSTASSSVINSEAAKPSRSMAVADALVWIDLEMTGLDPETDTILEIACLVTNGDLTMTIEGPSLVVHQPEEVLLNMNDWCKEHHGKSGLTQRVRGSSTTMAQAENAVLAFITNYVPDAKRAQLAGNSVHNDRVFLMKYMPKITEHLDHRIVDVSSIGELCKRWFPKEFRNRPRKGNKHTALVDIKESVHELRYYKQHVFKKK